MRPILVIGGMNMDILGVPDAGFILRDSNSGQVRIQPGGVGRNIAQHLAALGAQVELMSVLGNDAHADILTASCATQRIGLRYTLRVQGKTCVYLAIHDSEGDMVAALNDMGSMKRLTAQSLKTALPSDAFSACVLDANLSEEALIAAMQHVRAPLIADPVSCVKADRLRPILPRLTALKPNLREAMQMTGRQTVEEAAETLLDTGILQVYISLGNKGLYYATREDRAYLPALPTSNAPATGAGDAMVAGLSFAIAQGKSIRESALFGRECATRHLKAMAQPAS
jgi:pseudouridine kinase